MDNLLASLRSNGIGHDVFEDSLATLLNNYKEDVKVNYIFAAPNTAAAYFALFQKLNNYLIFDPLNNKDDVKMFRSCCYEPQQCVSSCGTFQEPL